MGFETVLGLGVIALVILFVFAPSALAGLIDGSTGYFTATQLQPKIGQDEIICDLRVEVNAEMVDSDIFFLIDEKPHVRINSVTPEYFDCFAKSAPNTMSLLNFNHLHGMSELDVLIFTPQVLTSDIKLIDSNDGSQQVSSALQPQLKHSRTFQSGEIIDTPFNISETFVVTNIPARQYVLEINYNSQTGLISGIDGKSLGQPYITTVPAL